PLHYAVAGEGARREFREIRPGNGSHTRIRMAAHRLRDGSAGPTMLRNPMNTERYHDIMVTQHIQDVKDKIQHHMPVVCSQGGQVGTVDHLDAGNTIKLTKDDNGQHHWIPIDWVTSVDY